MTYRVLISEQAQHDILQAHDYIVRHAPLNADRWLIRLYERVEGFGDMPRSNPMDEEHARRPREYRKMTVGNYRVVFSVNDEDHTVRVAHVWHAAGDPSARAEEPDQDA